MKKLPEHSPKASAWEDLLKKGTFESQLDSHLPTLPQFAPEDAAWERITAELDRKKVIPIWVRWATAAAVAVILLLSALSLDKSGDSIREQQPVAENPTEKGNAAVEVAPSESPKMGETVALNSEKASNASSSPKTKRTVEVIEIPKMTLPELELSQSKNLSLEMPEKKIPASSPPKTLHQVSISWSKIKPGLQVKTSFGRMGSELGQKPQASIQGVSPMTVVEDISKDDLR